VCLCNARTDNASDARFKRLLLSALAALLIITISPVLSYAGRPFSTEDAGVAVNGVFQTELSFDYARADADGHYSFLLVPITGISHDIEFSVEVPAMFMADDAEMAGGISDINLVMKTMIFQEKDMSPALLLKTWIKFANGDISRGMGSGDEDIGFSGVATKALLDFVLHANLGYVFTGKRVDNTADDVILYGIACEYSLSQRIKIALELYGESNPHFDPSVFKHHILNPLTGIVLYINEMVYLDSAFRIGINRGEMTEYGFTLGATLNF